MALGDSGNINAEIIEREWQEREEREETPIEIKEIEYEELGLMAKGRYTDEKLDDVLMMLDDRLIRERQTLRGDL